MQTPCEQMRYTVPAGNRPRWRGRAAWWRFTRHLLEIVAAMVAGMAALGIAVAALGELPGLDEPTVQCA